MLRQPAAAGGDKAALPSVWTHCGVFVARGEGRYWRDSDPVPFNKWRKALPRPTKSPFYKEDPEFLPASADQKEEWHKKCLQKQVCVCVCDVFCVVCVCATGARAVCFLFASRSDGCFWQPNSISTARERRVCLLPFLAVTPHGLPPLIRPNDSGGKSCSTGPLNWKTFRRK